MSDLQHTVLNAALPHIAFDGWNMSVLENSAIEAGLSAAHAHQAFPDGVLGAILLHTHNADSQMTDTLAKDYNLATMRVRERIATAVLVRLNAHSSHRETIRRAAALLAMPWNAPLGLKALYATVDAMWRAAGDTSTDFNFYTKRLLLANVYMSTLHVWLSDDSPQFRDTEAFLYRRIEDVMKIEKTKAKMKQTMAGFGSFGFAYHAKR